MNSEVLALYGLASAGKVITIAVGINTGANIPTPASPLILNLLRTGAKEIVVVPNYPVNLSKWLEMIDTLKKSLSECLSNFSPEEEILEIDSDRGEGRTFSASIRFVK